MRPLLRSIRHIFSGFVSRWRADVSFTNDDDDDDDDDDAKKDVYSSSWNLRATERHLPYGITQCYLPPDTGERAPP